jgi:hypothetical protein
MSRIATVLMLAGVLACGGGPESAPRSRADASRPREAPNRPPAILSVALAPSEPSIEDRVKVVLQARDPERDALAIEVTWLLNGAPFRSGPDEFISAELFAPGDRLSAVVRVSDGEFDASAETEPATIRDREPRITQLRIRPEKPTAMDSVVADVRTHDPEGSDVELLYRWLRNGVEMPGQEGPTLAAGSVRRGDRIQVGVTPRDARGNEGTEVLSDVVRVENSPPQITSKPPFSLAGTDVYEYAMQVEDPDGDRPLRFELVRGPSGMKIDLVTGRLIWQIPTQAIGNHDIEVLVTDPFGGEARQSYAVKVDVEQPPAARP